MSRSPFSIPQVVTANSSLQGQGWGGATRVGGGQVDHIQPGVLTGLPGLLPSLSWVSKLGLSSF